MVKNEMFSTDETIKGKFLPLIFTTKVLHYEEEYVFFPLLTFVTNQKPSHSSSVFHNEGTIGIGSCPTELQDYSYIN